RVKVNVTLLGGGFGRKSKPDYVVEAALLSRAVGAPVKVTWTREDEIHHDYYHTVNAQHLEAALDARGRAIAWLHRAVFPAIPSTFQPNVIYASNGELSQGVLDVPYDIPNIRCENGEAEPHVRIGWFRSVLNIPHAFAVCSFADELAYAAGRDPKDYLLELLGPPRHVDAGPHYENYGDDRKVYPIDTGRLRRVVDLVAERARWGRRLPAGHGLGIAVHRSFVSYVAAVVEAAVGKDGTVSVPCVDMAVDCGFAAYPDRIRPQMEGPAVMALSSALYGEMTFREGRALQNNFNDFQVARMNVAPGRLTCTSSRAMRRPVGSGNRGCHHSLRRCATRSSPRSGSGFAACPSRISCEAKRTSKGRPAMTLADKTATAVTTCALAIALGLVLLTMPVWGQAGQAGEQSAQTGWFRVSWA